MTNFAISSEQTYSSVEEQCQPSVKYTLKWRQRQLLVSLPGQVTQFYLPTFESQRRLVECLKYSPVKLVRVDPYIGEAGLKFWADACEQAGKAIFLKVPANPELLKKKTGVNWWLKRLIEWLVAAMLLLILSPLMLFLTCLIYSQSSQPIFTKQWRVGKRGKLFRTFMFCTTVDPEVLYENLHTLADAPRFTPLGSWMRKYRLHKLPQLVNVLQGEMTLVGPHPWILHDAVRLSPHQQPQLNALPGITGIWRMNAKLQLHDVDAMVRSDLDYLSSWSLVLDLKIMLLSIPRILLGCGAH